MVKFNPIFLSLFAPMRANGVYSNQTPKGGSSPILSTHYLIACFVVLAVSVNAQLSYFSSVAIKSTASGTNNDFVSGIDYDASGNIYVVGTLLGLVDFDPLTAGVQGPASLLSNKGFIAKYDSTGHLLWYGMIPGASGSTGTAIRVSGNAVYVAGIQTAGSLTSGYIAKYPLTGTSPVSPIWSFSTNSSGVSGNAVSPSDIEVDASSNIYVTGTFVSSTSNIDFDPSTNTTNLTNASGSYASGYLAMYDGNQTPTSTSFFKWAFAINGNTSADGSTYGGMSNFRLALNNSSLYLTGKFVGTNIDFDPSSNSNTLTLNTTTTGPIFFAKYDVSLLPSNVNFFKWVFQAGGPFQAAASGIVSSPGDITVDNTDKIYSIGHFILASGASNVADFDPGAGTTPTMITGGSSPAWRSYLVSYDGSLTPTTAGFYRWSFPMAGVPSTAVLYTGNGRIGRLDIDGNGDLVVAGNFTGTRNVNPLGTANNLASSDIIGISIAKYNSSGICQWAHSLSSTVSGTNSNAIQAIRTNGTGKVYTGGLFQAQSPATIDIDPSASTVDLQSFSTGTDALIAVYYDGLLPPPTPIVTCKCNYTGPKLLINEIMVAPPTGNGSIATALGYSSPPNGEWIELYNPNPCLAADVSCYSIGTSYSDEAMVSVGYTIPYGTIVPPFGFLIIRGVNSPAVPSSSLVANGGNVVELIVTSSQLGWNSTPSTNWRFYLPDLGGWIGLYDNIGIPIDAFKFGNVSNTALNTPSSKPAIQNCGPASTTLSGFYSFPQQNNSYSDQLSIGYSIARAIDGQAWPSNVTLSMPTYASCNGACNVYGQLNLSVNASTNNICSSTPVTLTASGATSYSWSPSSTLSSSSGASVVATPTQTTTYTVIGSNADCIDTLKVTINVGSTLNITVNSETICTGGSATLNAVGATNYQWSPSTGLSSTNGSSVLANPTSTTTYTIIGTSGNCIDTTTATVYVADSLNISVNSATICSGDSVTLIANGAQNYLWSPSTGLSGTNGSSVIAFPGSSAQYTVIGTSAGCSDSAVSIITVIPGVTISAASTNATCGNNNGTASVSTSAGSSPFIFSWSNGATSSSLNNLSPGNYSVTVSGANGCSAMANVTVGSSSINPATISSEKSVMCASDSARMCATQGYVSYLWNTGATDSCIVAKNAGGYWVTVTDVNGCSAISDRKNLTVYPVPSVSIVVQGDTLSSFGAVAYQWYRNGTIIDGATNSVYVAKESGNYSVEITDNNGCKAHSTELIFTGLENENDLFLEVFPNPTSDIIYVKASPALIGKEVMLYDALGQLLYKKYLDIKNFMIDMRDFPSGSYFLKCNSLAFRVKKI